MENIRLDYATIDDKKMCEIDRIMFLESGIKEIFGNRRDRLATSAYSWLIKADDKTVGFINLVEEKQNKDFLFLDAGIIKEYRNRKLGTYAINRVKEILDINKIKTYVIGETKVDNIKANNSILKSGCYLMQYEDRNLYLLQSERLVEFMDNGYYEKLTEHLAKSSKRILIKE